MFNPLLDEKEDVGTSFSFYSDPLASYAPSKLKYARTGENVQGSQTEQRIGLNRHAQPHNSVRHIYAAGSLNAQDSQVGGLAMQT